METNYIKRKQGHNSVINSDNVVGQSIAYTTFPTGSEGMCCIASFLVLIVLKSLSFCSATIILSKQLQLITAPTNYSCWSLHDIRSYRSHPRNPLHSVSICVDESLAWVVTVDRLTVVNSGDSHFSVVRKGNFCYVHDSLSPSESSSFSSCTYYRLT